MDEKQEMLSKLRVEFQRWEQVLADLSETQITSPQLNDGWSIKDVVAHLWAWQQRSNARLLAALHHHEPRFPDWPTDLDPETADQPHQLNDWLYTSYRDLPWGSVYQQWHDSFRQLLALAEAIPAEDLQEVEHYPWLKGYALMDVLEGTLEHHAEHHDYLAPVLAKLSGQDSTP